MPTTLPQYDADTDFQETDDGPLTVLLSEISEGAYQAYGWVLSWVNSDTTDTELTIDSCGYMVEWEFVIWDADDSPGAAPNTTIADDAIGIHIDYDDDAGTFYSTYAGDDIEDASFSSLAFNVDGITFTGDVALGDSETEALGEIYNPPGGDLTNMVDSYVAEVAASSIGTIEPAHTFKKIETPEIDDETFDVLEGEEGAQAVTVSTTYTY